MAKEVAGIAKLSKPFQMKTGLLIWNNLKDGYHSVCDLTEAFKTGQSRLSFQLRVLKDAGLILARPEGRWMYYSLNEEAVEIYCTRCYFSSL